MQEMFLGEAIKRRRLELGLTQEQLCEGICEPITISRLENGKQTPSRNRINALLERLDMPADRYFALLSKNELDVEALQKTITAYNVQFSQAKGEEKKGIRDLALKAHQELEAIIEKDDMMSRQLILRSKLLLGKESGRYSYPEQREILLEAIRLTSPSFDLKQIANGLYTTDEIKLINHIALTHIYAKECDAAIEILSQLYEYIPQHFHNISLSKAHMNMVSYNYALVLLMDKQYEKAVQIAEEGRRCCLDTGHYLSLSGLMSVLAEAWHFLGDDDKSKDLYYQTYYLMKVIGDEHNIEFVKQDAKEYLGIEFS